MVIPLRCSCARNYLGLPGNNGLHTGGDIFDRNIDTTSRPIAVERVYGKTAKLEDGLAHRFAGDRAVMNAYASDHAGAVNYRDAFACLCRSNRAFLPRWATADYNEIVFGRTHFAGLKSGNVSSSH